MTIQDVILLHVLPCQSHRHELTEMYMTRHVYVSSTKSLSSDTTVSTMILLNFVCINDRSCTEFVILVWTPANVQDTVDPHQGGPLISLHSSLSVPQNMEASFTCFSRLERAVNFSYVIATMS